MWAVTALKDMAKIRKHRTLALCGDPAVLTSTMLRALREADASSSWIDVTDPVNGHLTASFLPVVLVYPDASEIKDKQIERILAETQQRVVFCWSARDKLGGLAEKFDAWIDCSPMGDKLLHSYVLWCAGRHGVTLDDDGAISIVATRLREQQNRIDPEIQKMSLWAAGRPVTSKGADQLVPVLPDCTAEMLADATSIGDRRTVVAMALAQIHHPDQLVGWTGLLAVRVKQAHAWDRARSSRMDKRTFCTKYKVPAFRFDMIASLANRVADKKYGRFVRALCVMEAAFRRGNEHERFQAIVWGVGQMI